jgi:hypothetical protein
VHHQLFLAIQPIQFFVIHRVPLANQSPAQPALAEPAAWLSQLPQPLAQWRVVRTLALIPQSRMIDPDQPARAALTELNPCCSITRATASRRTAGFSRFFPGCP